MSDNTTTQTPQVVTTIPEAEVATHKKPSLWRRSVVDPIKKHPRIATAIVGGIALVGVFAAVALTGSVEENNSDSEDSSLDDFMEFEQEFTDTIA